MAYLHRSIQTNRYHQRGAKHSGSFRQYTLALRFLDEPLLESFRSSPSSMQRLLEFVVAVDDSVAKLSNLLLSAVVQGATDLT